MQMVHCSGKTSQKETVTNGENDEDEWTVSYFRQNTTKIRSSRAPNADEHGQNLPDEVQEDLASSSMEQNNPRDGNNGSLKEPVGGNEEQLQAPQERQARTRRKPSWLRDYE